ncbi:MAG: NAD(P)/FAD-dependent oxidoreductase [Alphaproteobacteria bacterium]|nr:NAD(P)/FAD-dependent oxidoreductase [Alphaproteobacteria bacterium]
MATERFDVLALGGGNAGMGVTVPTRAAGMKVALVESWTLGGTCVHRGCTPKKALVGRRPRAGRDRPRARPCHPCRQAPLDWARLIDREKAMIDWMPAAFAATLKKRGVTVIKGRAAFAGPDSVRVGRRVLVAKHIVIATGSTPRSLPFPGAEHLITSDEVLSERTLPRTVVFIGGGVIGLEFSHVYARAGARVTILEVLPRLLPNVDADAVHHLCAESERIGIAIKTAASVRRIDKVGRRLRVSFEHEGKARTILADRVVNGAGRVANIEGLDLAAGRVAYDGTRIKVDKHLRSVSNPAVWVCGDVLWSSPQLSPIATYKGRLVGRNIVDGRSTGRTSRRSLRPSTPCRRWPASG